MVGIRDHLKHGSIDVRYQFFKADDSCDAFATLSVISEGMEVTYFRVTPETLDKLSDLIGKYSHELRCNLLDSMPHNVK